MVATGTVTLMYIGISPAFEGIKQAWLTLQGWHLQEGWLTGRAAQAALEDAVQVL